MVKFTTEAGYTYKINRKNQIFKEGQTPSDQWTFKWFVDRYNHIVNPDTGEHRTQGGRGKYHLVDTYKGTDRKWPDRVVSVEYLPDMEDYNIL